MTDIPYRTALIVGAGPGISASLARGLAAAGLRVGVAARNVDKLTPLAAETGAQTFAVDASQPAGVARLFEDADTRLGEPDVVVYNASARAQRVIPREPRIGDGVARGDDAELGEAQLKAEHMETKAEVTLDKVADGYAITAVHLTLTAKIPGADQAKFEELAAKAKVGCPVSKLLNTKITLDATLAS